MPGKMRLGLMGGTFDPVHEGHLACARAARDACELDRVLFVPAARPSFKRERRLAAPETRLELCRLALADEPCFDVSDVELRRDGVTYTVDTLRELHARAGDGAELYFIMGADAAASLPRWREAEELARLAVYVVVSRPGQVFDADLRASLAKMGFKVVYAEGLCMDVSSSEVRARIAAGESLEGLVPESIRSRVEAEPVYQGESFSAEAEDAAEPAASGGGADTPAEAGCLSAEVSADDADALSDAFFAARKRDLSARVSERRLHHVEGVVAACERLARLYGEDVRKARLAGLLHDWDKGYDDLGIRTRVRELGMEGELDPWIVSNMPQVLHGHTAARALSREFPQIPEDVIQAVDRHTVAAIDMTKLDMIVYIADAVEESRRFGRIDELRAAVGETDLEELFFLTYEYWTLLLFERRRQLHPETIRIWNALVARRAARRKEHDGQDS